ncbi:MAG TPA: twin-arginine translocase TatA/TatE family subunit, partial [Acidobacteriota bacterium]
MKVSSRRSYGALQFLNFGHKRQRNNHPFLPAWHPLPQARLVVILIIAVFIFGPSKIPAVGRGLGEAIRNFKKGIREASQI